MEIFSLILLHVIVLTIFFSHGYTPFRGPLLVASSNRDLASSASLLVLGPPVMGSAGCFCSLLSPLLECSAWHSLDTCLVSYDGVGSTHDGRRACCCFRLLLGSPVLGSAGWFCSLLCPFWSVLLGTRQIPAWYCIMGLGPPVLGGGRAAAFVAAFVLLFVLLSVIWANGSFILKGITSLLFSLLFSVIWPTKVSARHHFTIPSPPSPRAGSLPSLWDC